MNNLMRTVGIYAISIGTLLGSVACGGGGSSNQNGTDTSLLSDVPQGDQSNYISPGQMTRRIDNFKVSNEAEGELYYTTFDLVEMPEWKFNGWLLSLKGLQNEMASATYPLEITVEDDLGNTLHSEFFVECETDQHRHRIDFIAYGSFSVHLKMDRDIASLGITPTCSSSPEFSIEFGCRAALYVLPGSYESYAFLDSNLSNSMMGSGSSSGQNISSGSLANEQKTTVIVGEPEMKYNKLKDLKLLHKATIYNCSPGEITDTYSITHTRGSKTTTTASGSITVSEKVSGSVNAGMASAGCEHSISGTLTGGVSVEEDSTVTETVTLTATVPGKTHQTITVTQPVWEFEFDVDVTTITEEKVWVRRCPHNTNVIHICNYGSWEWVVVDTSTITITTKGETNKEYIVWAKNAPCPECDSNFHEVGGENRECQSKGSAVFDQ